MKKRILALLLSLAMLLSLTSLVMAEEAPKGKLVILHTNDVHGRAVADPVGGYLGYAAISQYKKDLEAAGDSVLLLDAGDASQGTPLVNLEQGKNAITFLNAVGYHAMAMGSHEFDWGVDNWSAGRRSQIPLPGRDIVDHLSQGWCLKPTRSSDAKWHEGRVFGLTTPETL